MAGRGGTSQGIATVEYLVAVAKDWTRARFAAAQSSQFVFAAHRFEPSGAGFRRVALPVGSPEAVCPCAAVTRAARPTVWAHSTVVSLLAESDAGTLEFEQEMIEILGMEGEAVLAEAAAVLRIPGLGVCLGPFHGPE
jgi:hypothetical protein